MLTSRGLPSDSTRILKDEPGKLGVKRHEPGILFISTLQTSNYDVIIEFRVDDVIQKAQRHEEVTDEVFYFEFSEYFGVKSAHV